MKNQIEIASDVNNSSSASTGAHETRKNRMNKVNIFKFVTAMFAASILFASCGKDKNKKVYEDRTIALELVSGEKAFTLTLSHGEWKEGNMYTMIQKVCEVLGSVMEIKSIGFTFEIQQNKKTLKVNVGKYIFEKVDITFRLVEQGSTDEMKIYTSGFFEDAPNHVWTSVEGKRECTIENLPLWEVP